MQSLLPICIRYPNKQIAIQPSTVFLLGNWRTPNCEQAVFGFYLPFRLLGHAHYPTLLGSKPFLMSIRLHVERGAGKRGFLQVCLLICLYVSRLPEAFNDVLACLPTTMEPTTMGRAPKALAPLVWRRPKATSTGGA